MKRYAFLLPVVAGACGLVVFELSAPAYLRHQGFPLDDSWIHAVYARELARSAMLAYNPGVPANGETAPLWAVLLGLVRLLAGEGEAFVVSAKAFGFALHVLSALVLGAALRVVADEESDAWLAAALVALHPDLIAASVSGMEVPLATLVVAGAIGAAAHRRPRWTAAVGGIAVLARPETAAVVCVFPLLYWIRTDRRAAWTLSGAAVGGSILVLILLGLRNEMISGMALPATFYAKVHHSSLLDLLANQWRGFGLLLGRLPLVGPAFLTTDALLLAVCFRRKGPMGRRPESGFLAMLLTGAFFCALSFALIPPVDPAAFYHQRYVLPALPLLVGVIPLLCRRLAKVWTSRLTPIATWAVIGALFVVLFSSSRTRALRLSNDARNVDDVQVALGRSLAGVAPGTVFWTTDAGASRYFGRAFVVDLIGLNSPALLTDHAQAFLDSHEPNFIELFPTWSALDAGSAALPSRVFRTTTAYTVTSIRAMETQTLATCTPEGRTGVLVVRDRRFTFRCASVPTPGS